MPITTVGIGAAVTPTVIKTYLSHYTQRKPRRQKPTAHIAYDEGLHLIRCFLEYASHHTVEDLQSFTAQWVPSPSWVRTENVPIPAAYITQAADTLIAELGDSGIKEVGGQQWWQWRRKTVDLKGEWVEMRADYNARKQLNEPCRRVMMYVHGGAYFFGSVDEHRYQLQRHARKLKARVFAPRYRLAPQFPFPCGLLDCLASYLYLLSLHDATEIVLAGDSAGGGMIISILCTLRDQGLPLPAGAILISPWVDLTHSFPSVAGSNDLDYIPAHGFMQKPSASWPPPNDNDMEAIKKGAATTLVKDHHKLEKNSVQREQAQGVVVSDIANGNSGVAASEVDNEPELATAETAVKSIIPGPSQHLSIEVEGKKVELRDQIQMYTTNQLLSHPLVSPVLQPSLGGLPPLLILIGGGEVLRDEQIYLAHKAANPTKYHLGDEYRAQYDPDDTILNKYKPTSVHLQVWEDLCHVAPTLSFTRPAKYMYRSISQFGAWALARAQNTNIELVDDDNISVISRSEPGSESEDQVAKQKASLARRDTKLGAIGKAGDPIPNFRNHMIRQRVDRHGNIYPLDPPSELAGLQLSANEIGKIKVGPVKKWMDARKIWDTKYARIKRDVQRKRVKDLTRRNKTMFGGDEQPPPSALAGRQHEEGELTATKLKKSFYLAMWSGWGSKHDEDTIKREQEFAGQSGPSTDGEGTSERDAMNNARSKKSRSMSRSRKTSNPKQDVEDDRSRSRKRMVAIPDRDQTEIKGDAADSGSTDAVVTNQLNSIDTRATDGTDESHLTPMFLPKFKTQQHLRNDSKDISDSASVRTGISNFSTPDNASTMAVFAAPGVSKLKVDTGNNELEPEVGQQLSPLRQRTNSGGSSSTIRLSKRPRSALGGYDTPVSRRSVERLMSHQIEVLGPDGEGAGITSAADGAAAMDGDETGNASATNGIGAADVAPDPARTPQSGGGLSSDGLKSNVSNLSRIQMARSPSSVAIVQAEGIVGVIEGGVADEKQTHSEAAAGVGPKSTSSIDHTPKRPTMYDRQDSEFQTAMEEL